MYSALHVAAVIVSFIAMRIISPKTRIVEIEARS